MATYLNKVLLKGRLGQDPTLRFLPSGDPVCNFSIATRTGQHVEWHKIVCYKKLAEEANRDFRTGDLVYVEAEIRTREFLTEEDKKAGRKPRKVLELWANEAHLVAKRDQAGDADDLGEGGELPPSSDQAAPHQDDTGAAGSSVPKFI